MIDINKMTVLVADDMENMYNSIRSIMRLLKFGRRFLYVPNGEEALKILRKEDIDMAILDNNMPGMKGVDLLQIIRSDSLLCELPVIMITADANMEFVTNAAESEIDAYLLKPITVGLLKEKIPPVIENANNPSPMVLHLRNARHLGEKGDYDNAIQEAMNAMAANPNSSKPLREIGFYYMKKDFEEEAEEHLMKAAKMNKVDVVAFNHLGDLYMRQDKIDQAIGFYSKAVELSPRNYERSLNLGKLLIQKKMPEKAQPVLSKVYELCKKPLELKQEVSDLCIKAGVYDYAGKLLKDIMNLEPANFEAIFKLGSLHAAKQEYEDALDCFTEAERLNDTHIALKLQMARVYMAQGLLIRAEKPLNAVMKLDPENKEARKLLRECI